MALGLSEGYVHTRVAKTTIFTEGIGTAGVKLNVWLWVHRCSMFGKSSLSENRKRNENIDVSRVFGLRDEVQVTLSAAVFIQHFCSHSEFSVTVFQVVAFHSSDADVRKSWQRWIVSGRSSVRKARFFQREFKAQVLSATCGVGFVRGVCSHKGCENHYFYRGNWNRRCQAQRVALGSSV